MYRLFDVTCAIWLGLTIVILVCFVYPTTVSTLVLAVCVILWFTLAIGLLILARYLDKIEEDNPTNRYNSDL